MAGNKKPRKRRTVKGIAQNPRGILNRLTVPQERLQVLKAACDAELLRLYMGTGTMQDMNAIYTVLVIGDKMLKYVEEKEEAKKTILKGQNCLVRYREFPTEKPNLDDFRNALDVVYQIWGLLSVEEFVGVCRELKTTTV